MEKEDFKRKIKPADASAAIRNRNSLFLIIKWFVLILIFVFVIFLATQPLRGKVARSYVEKGNQYLAEKKYISAEIEYKKALILDSDNKEAETNIELADEASKNVEALESFYKKSNYSDQFKTYQEATAFPKNEVEAVKLAKKLIEKKEYQLAIIPAMTATEMAPDYRDAWVYLGIANKKTADEEQISPEGKKVYLARVKIAEEKIKEIDPEYSLNKK